MKSNNNQSTKFRAPELDALMDIVEAILPIGKLEWDKVGAKYNTKFKHRRRIVRNLRNKFNSFANKKAPTGDPDCPPLVRRAKRITELIKSKAGMAVITSGNQRDAPAIDPPVVASKRNASKVIAQPPSKKNRVSSGSNAERFLEAFLISEKMQAKREAKDEKMRHAERQETMRLMMGTMASLAAAFAGGKSIDAPAGMDMPKSTSKIDSTFEINSSDSAFSSDSDTDSSSSSGVGHKKKLSFIKKMKLRRKQKKLQKALKNSSNSPGKKGAIKCC
jgi:hypothetical protein